MNPERMSRVYNDRETTGALLWHSGNEPRGILVRSKSGILGINDGLVIVRS
ncbi:hypothetical protein GCM10022226_33920 [Sphaerisporangium flaviroseum]|uniref:Uncharacterized protein n=1 Tax=Sphaerisporangium flaviroseum TaxID=509199 RepID=A0ABP7I339_9ACTN